MEVPLTKRQENILTPEDREWLVGQLGLLQNDLVDQITETETKLLTAFYKWASPTDIKLRSIPALEERLQLLEERVRDIEMRGGKPQ